MRPRLILGALAIAAVAVSGAPSAHAIGCLSGGAAGALAGHMAHHGVLGAAGGCIAGHEYGKHQRQAAEERSSENDNRQDRSDHP